MANKTYKMTVTLSNGNTVDAGTFIVPEGEIGSIEETSTTTMGLPATHLCRQSLNHRAKSFNRSIFFSSARENEKKRTSVV